MSTLRAKAYRNACLLALGEIDPRGKHVLAIFQFLFSFHCSRMLGGNVRSHRLLKENGDNRMDLGTSWRSPLSGSKQSWTENDQWRTATSAAVLEANWRVDKAAQNDFFLAQRSGDRWPKKIPELCSLRSNFQMTSVFQTRVIAHFFHFPSSPPTFLFSLPTLLHLSHACPSLANPNVGASTQHSSSNRLTLLVQDSRLTLFYLGDNTHSAFKQANQQNPDARAAVERSRYHFCNSAASIKRLASHGCIYSYEPRRKTTSGFYFYSKAFKEHQSPCE